MTITAYILIAFVVIIIAIRLLTKNMYALKPHQHTETPEKFGIDFEAVRFPTDNQKSLYGWWVPAAVKPETATTLILVHGWDRNLGRMLRYIQNLHPLNYNLLAFDARHHGSSDQDDHASMYKFGKDVQSAVNFVQTLQIDENRIGVIGLSLGGAGAIFASALHTNIRAVVTVGAPAHPVDIMTHEFKRHRIPSFLIWFILKQVEFKIGVNFEVFAPVNNISKSDAGFLIIHGDNDGVVLPSQGEILHRAAKPGQCEFWRIPDRGHSNCHHEPGFWDKVDAFMQSTLEQ